MKFVQCFLISLLLWSPLASARAESASCSSSFQMESSQQISNELRDLCTSRKCSESMVEKIFYTKLVSSKGKAYAALATIMMTTSGASAIISSLVGANNPTLSSFVAIFLSQITTLGVFVVGAPIWEPIQSRVRALAYQVTGHHQETKDPNLLEQQFFRTNRSVSSNAQWGRGALSHSSRLVSHGLYEARRAAMGQEREYAAALLAEVMVRLHFLYPDVSPTHPVILKMVRLSFTHFVPSPESLKPLVRENVRELDPDNNYDLTISEWLTRS